VNRMAAPGQKRGPEHLRAEKKETEGKRLPEYSCREEEAIAEGYLTQENPKAEAIKKTNGLEELWMGTSLLKYTRRGGAPHFKYVQLSRDNSYLRWFTKKKKLEVSSINVKSIQKILKGQQTEVFKKSEQKQLEVASFSVIYNENDTFDVVAKGQDEATLWVETLTALLGKKANLSECKEIEISIPFVDRYRVGNRQGLEQVKGTGKLEKSVIKQLTSDIKKARKKLQNIESILQKEKIQKHEDAFSLPEYAKELSLRIEKVEQLFTTSTNDKICRSDTWRLNVDLDCILEKCQVLSKNV